MTVVWTFLALFVLGALATALRFAPRALLAPPLPRSAPVRLARPSASKTKRAFAYDRSWDLWVIQALPLQRGSGTEFS